MILNALVERLKRRSKDAFKGRHYEACVDASRDAREIFRVSAARGQG